MTAGTRPAPRSERATPLPAFSRTVADKVADAIGSPDLLLEKRAHRLLAVNVPDCLRQQFADGQHVQLRKVLLLRNPDGVGDRHLRYRRISEPLDGWAGEQRMRCADIHILRAEILQRARGL